MLIVSSKLIKNRPRRTESTSVYTNAEALVSPSISLDVALAEESIMTQIAVLPPEETHFPFQGFSQPNLQQERDSTTFALSRQTIPQPIHTPIPRPQPTIDRFENYIEDNLGSYAPSFRGDRSNRSSDHGSHSIFDLHDLADPIRSLEVEMGTRSTLDIEEQVTNLDSADMEYLRSKGTLSHSTAKSGKPS